MTHELEVNEGVQPVDATNSPATMIRKKYRVLAEKGIFKNGKLYAKGEEVELVEKTADSFKKAEGGPEVEDVT